MKYKVHRLPVKGGNVEETLEKFLNQLNGEVISVTPEITNFFLFYGVKISSFLVVEKVR